MPRTLRIEEPCECAARSVLTDRAFLAEPRTMLWAFLLGGLVAGTFIILFGLLGVFGAAQAITHPSRHAPSCICTNSGEHAESVHHCYWVAWHIMMPCCCMIELVVEPCAQNATMWLFMPQVWKPCFCKMLRREIKHVLFP